MTPSEAIKLESCPDCGSPVMKVPSTGLVSCLANLDFKECSWHIRLAPFENFRQRERITKREQLMREQQEEINRRIAEAHEHTNT